MTEAERRGAPLIVGPDARFEGLLTFRGTAVIEGELSGSILAQGTLVLGPDARVDAQIEVDQLISAGRASGEIIARERIELSASAHVSGVLRTPRLVVAEGCRVAARCFTGAGAESADSGANSASPAA